MKATLGNKSDCCKEKPYPKLVKSARSGAIFLMTSEIEGTVVSGQASSGDTIGYHSSFWSGCDEDYEGSVTLCND